jgi:hypothetical protein
MKESDCHQGKEALATINTTTSTASWEEGKLTIQANGTTAGRLSDPEIQPVQKEDLLQHNIQPEADVLYFIATYCEAVNPYTTTFNEAQEVPPSKVKIITPEGIKEIPLQLPQPPVGEIINISILVDAENIVNQILDTGTVDAPLSLESCGDADNFIYMIAKSGFVSNNQQAKSELGISAKIGDKITWNMTTFGNNAKYSAFMYASEFQLESGDGKVGVSPVSYTNQEVEVYLPSSNDPADTPEKYTNTIYTASTRVINTDQTLQYTLSFQLVNDATGEVLGYFSWDPYIVI